MGFCLWADIDQLCFEKMFKRRRNDVRERKMTLRLGSRTPSLLQDCASLPAFLI
jgi:hypothetical protein